MKYDRYTAVVFNCSNSTFGVAFNIRSHTVTVLHNSSGRKYLFVMLQHWNTTQQHDTHTAAVYSHDRPVAVHSIDIEHTVKHNYPLQCLRFYPIEESHPDHPHMKQRTLYYTFYHGGILLEALKKTLTPCLSITSLQTATLIRNRFATLSPIIECSGPLYENIFYWYLCFASFISSS